MLITVEGVARRFLTSSGAVDALRDVCLSVTEGEFCTIIGPSGCGKSTLLGMLAGLVAPDAGRVLIAGRPVSGPDPRTVATVFQDPGLFPWRTVVENIEFGLELQGVDRVTRRRTATELLGPLGLRDFAGKYPRELSGGMRQRVAIAIALLNRPDLIIADEPTTALDVTIQGQILFEVQKLCRQTGTALIWITHDLSVVASLADEICVMYAGRIVEQGIVDDVLDRPAHPYTDGLLRSVPSANPRGRPLRQIPGMTPSLLNLPSGCAFRQRCERADSVCVQVPEITEPVLGRRVRCFHPLLEAVTA
jgi:peptide/nickel transport system ATP-binding protein